MWPAQSAQRNGVTSPSSTDVAASLAETSRTALRIHDGGSSSHHSGRRIVILLPRNDLRILDNPVIYHAHKHEAQPTHVLALYVFDERQIECSGLPGYKRKCKEARTHVCKFWRTGVIRARFQTEAVYDLQNRLRERGSDLLIRFGQVDEVVENVIKALQARGDEVVGLEMQKEICSEEVQVERSLAKRLLRLGCPPIRFHHSKHLIHRDDIPFDVKDTPDVFTPFRKRVEALGKAMVRPLIPDLERFLPFPESEDDKIVDDPNYGRQVEGLGMAGVLKHLLLPLTDTYESKYGDPNNPKHRSSAFPWGGGETCALDRLEYYFTTGQPPPVATYKETRNMLVGHAYSTKMSPFLSIGCISARQIYAALDAHEEKYGSNQNTYWVRFELLWRDYFLYVSEKFGDHLFNIEGFEGITDPKQAEKKRDDWNDWNPDDEKLKAWLCGRTGIPFLDANMVELRETGFMSNRGRQNVASFLTKDLYYDWRIGAEFFESHLVDYDPTANYGNWQYVAGVGNDPRASRQFNPIKQARDYDPTGVYVRTWIPQLVNVPATKIHTPWLMDEREWRRFLPGPQDKDNAQKPSKPRQSSNGNQREKGGVKSTLTPGGSGTSTPSRMVGQHSTFFSERNYLSDKNWSGGRGNGSSVSDGNSSTRLSSMRPSYSVRGESGGSSDTPTSSDGERASSKGSGAEQLQQNHKVDEPPHASLPARALSSVGSVITSVTSGSASDSGNGGSSDDLTHSSAVGLMRTLDPAKDYKSDIPYPRRPLFEQESWKPHYTRKDLGRKRAGPGGGNSRRLVRPGPGQSQA